jgi:hypothetical protein
MNRSKVRTALNKVAKALRELEDSVGDGHIEYLANIGVFTKDGKDTDLSELYGNVDRKAAIIITEHQMSDLKEKATRQQYEEVARELLANIPVERLS